MLAEKKMIFKGNWLIIRNITRATYYKKEKLIYLYFFD